MAFFLAEALECVAIFADIAKLPQASSSHVQVCSFRVTLLRSRRVVCPLQSKSDGPYAADRELEAGSSTVVQDAKLLTGYRSNKTKSFAHNSGQV